MRAREIMDTAFETLHPDNTVAEAVQRFSEISTALGRKMFGLKVPSAQPLAALNIWV